MNAWLQNFIPQHAVSRALGVLASARLGLLTRWAIQLFIKRYNVKLDEAEITDIHQFHSFNDFFTRALKPTARSFVENNNTLLSPVDGTVSECGAIQSDQLLQAKGAYFSLNDLCGGFSDVARHFNNGLFLTAYLAPKDYHRIHMPYTGKLVDMIYVPGDLFSVNPQSVQSISRLFARNERVICLFETDRGMLCVIAVGAMIVGSVATVWHGVVAPGTKIVRRDYRAENVMLRQGAEMGRFLLGSTVIVLTQPNQFSWKKELQCDALLRCGTGIGNASKIS